MKTGKYLEFWQVIRDRWRKASPVNAKTPQPTELISKEIAGTNGETVVQLREYLIALNETNARLNPKWLAARLKIDEREMLDALAVALHDGLVELYWEVYCPKCGARPAEFGSLEQAQCNVHCPACGNDFDLHLDRDVRVTFSATERLRQARAASRTVQSVLSDDGNSVPTRGLDLLLSPMFRKLFAGEAPSANESLRIGRVAVLFTDLRGSTAIYAERGDPRAYQMVREHFNILTRAIERHRGVLVKTIGDSVMASFASGAEAAFAAFEAQAVLKNRVSEIGGELVLKTGVHIGTCLAVNLNGQLDFFGGAVNTAARVQGLSAGGDVVVTDDVFTEMKESFSSFREIENFDSELRGLPAPVHVHRLVAALDYSAVSQNPW